MLEVDFCGFASQPGSVLPECMAAAGIDAGLGVPLRQPVQDDAAATHGSAVD